MDEIMEMLHDYVAMLARFTNGEGMTAPERARWLALSRILPGTGAAPEPAHDDDDDDGMPVQITAPGGFESARLLALSRDGMRLHLSHPLPVGTTTIVRVIAPKNGLEYTFPCKVAWADSERIGLAFDGAPGRTPLSKALAVGWRRPLDLRTGWGERAPLGIA